MPAHPDSRLQDARHCLATLERRRNWLAQQLAGRDLTRPYPARIAGELSALNWAIELMLRDIADREERMLLEEPR